MKLLLLLILVGIITAMGHSQTSSGSPACSEKSLENISSRGIKLRMTVEETLRLFSEAGNLTTAAAQYDEKVGGIVVTKNEYPLDQALINLRNDSAKSFGYSGIGLIPKDKTKYEGISRYEFGFLDSKLASLGVHYLKPKWENQEQFVRFMSTQLNVPVDESLLNSRYSLKCGNYTLALNLVSNSEARFSLSVSANISEIIRDRSKAAENELREKEIKAFKP